MGMVLVTGGAGFIGSCLAETLGKKQGLVSFDRKNSPKEELLDKKRIERAFEENEISSIVHLAALGGVRESVEDPLRYEENNIKATLNLLEAAKGKGIERFIFASSSSVYGNSTKGGSKEDGATNPLSPYAVTKRSCEMFCKTYSEIHGMPVTALRLFTTYGPNQRETMAISRFTRQIDGQEEIDVYGNGKTKRDFVHVTDVAWAIEKALESKKKGYDVINIGTSESTELNELIGLIEEGLGKKAKVRHKPANAWEAEETCADISKARKELGYKPKIKIEEGIDRYLEWYNKQKTAV